MTSSRQFKALVVRETADGVFSRALEHRLTTELPSGDLLVRVAYSSLNYKDALSASGNRGVSRRYPHTPGVDAAGVIAESCHPDWPVGAHVIVTGWDLGMNTDGGFAEYIRVPADWVVAMPSGLDLHSSMIYGTAGFTAAQSVSRLVSHGLPPGSANVLVTGASGGVGCVTVAILHHLGYQVTAVTGKAEAHDWLRSIGATTILERSDFVVSTPQSLLHAQWHGVIDTVGGDVLSSAIRATERRGIVACCGNVGGARFAIDVYPFILRGVTLAGVDSARCPQQQRQEIWERLGTVWKPQCLTDLARDVALDDLGLEIERMLAGEQRGRIVICL